ncbi:MAG: DmsE family decaheme c-type cytochrome [Halioglobus sp.]|nr:DmsE family decaheme c-type cytochrome [Halioglobus sp.]
MKRYGFKAAVYLCGALLCAAAAWAESEPGCLDCHTQGDDSAAHQVFKTVHGSLNGGGANACTACHGPSEKHDMRGKKSPVDISFGPRWTSDVETRNASCQGCHDNKEQVHWVGSAHQQENLACADCHQSHTPQDPVMSDDGAQALCLNCHTQVRAELQLPSRHPIIEGKTDCVDCHNPHGSLGDAALNEVTLNDNCFSCHQDKRGPFLWEHPPAAEDCSLCHRPHGSVNEPLLTARGPALCQQCHAAAFHPSVPYGSEGLAGGSANQNLLGKNCLNCHSQVHGSNHPSGARLTR